MRTCSRKHLHVCHASMLRGEGRVGRRQKATNQSSLASVLVPVNMLLMCVRERFDKSAVWRTSTSFSTIFVSVNARWTLSHLKRDCLRIFCVHLVTTTTTSAMSYDKGPVVISVLD